MDLFFLPRHNLAVPEKFNRYLRSLHDSPAIGTAASALSRAGVSLKRGRRLYFRVVP